MITVENLVYEYPTKRVLFDISFTIEKGSITVLVGPNGAGKTTLIRCLTALFSPFSGEIKFNGQDVNKNPLEAHKNMGYLPDFFGLYDDLTVRQCLTYAGLAQNIAEEEIQAKVIKAAKRLKIDNRIDDLAGDLSRGLRQRLAIAQAIIHEPEFLVLDEPASGLDPDARADLSNLFKQLRDEGMTLLVSSHILAELEDYATEMIIIRDGKLVGSKQSIENKNVITRRLVIRLSEEDDRLKEVLENNISVSSVSYEDGIATCVLSGGIEVQKNLLKELIKKDIPVSEYREGAVKLHDAYLRTIEQDLQETRQQGQ